MSDEKKLDLRIVSCFFVGYSENLEVLGFTVPPLRTYERRIMLNLLRIFRTVGLNYIRISHLRKNRLLYS